jgi:MerR family transcriptional regulator, light-induced transcriptional regulator
MIPDELLSPAQACAMAGVGPTTLKRWADAGVLPHVKTVGGHRRFRRAEIERFLHSRTQLGPAGSPEPNPWIAKLLRGPSHDVEAELLFARSRLGSWHRVAEELGRVLVEVGERWQRQELSVLDEHVVSERLARGLARIGEALPSRPGAPRALLACLEGDEHVLGLALVELSLREIGWTTLWAGARTPRVELERIVTGLQLELIALSASAGSSDADTLRQASQSLARACAPRGIALALGGEGPWPEDPEGARRFRDFASFQRFAAELPRSNA